MKNKITSSTVTQPPMPSINPWTNKPKQRGQGLLNNIMNKYINNCDDEDDYMGQQDQNKFNSCNNYSKQDQDFLKLAQTIMKFNQNDRIIQKSMRQVFKLKQRCDKIDQILQWIQKMQSKYEYKATKNKEQQEQAQNNDKNQNLSPIDSNFIYLPLHSITTFNQLIEQCQSQKIGHSIPRQIRSIGEFRNMKLKQAVQSIGLLADYSQMIQNVIL